MGLSTFCYLLSSSLCQWLLKPKYTHLHSLQRGFTSTTSRLGIGFFLHHLPSLISYHHKHAHTIIMSSSRLLIHHQTVTLGYQSVAPGSVVSGFARETSVQTKPQQCQRERTHIHYKHKKDRNQKKKRTKERGETPAFPLLPPNPCPPSLPPILPLSFVSKDQIKGPKETRRRRGGGGEAVRSRGAKGSKSCRGRAGRKGGGAGGGALEAADQKTKK